MIPLCNAILGEKPSSSIVNQKDVEGQVYLLCAVRSKLLILLIHLQCIGQGLVEPQVQPGKWVDWAGAVVFIISHCLFKEKRQSDFMYSLIDN